MENSLPRPSIAARVREQWILNLSSLLHFPFVFFLFLILCPCHCTTFRGAMEHSNTNEQKTWTTYLDILQRCVGQNPKTKKGVVGTCGHVKQDWMWHKRKRHPLIDVFIWFNCVWTRWVKWNQFITVRMTCVKISWHKHRPNSIYCAVYWLHWWMEKTLYSFNWYVPSVPVTLIAHAQAQAHAPSIAQHCAQWICVVGITSRYFGAEGEHGNEDEIQEGKSRSESEKWKCNH